MIFLDTSAIYALVDARDPNHREATELMARAVTTGQTLLIHNYMLVEAAAVLQRRLGLAIASEFIRQAHSFETHWVTPEEQRQAVEQWIAKNRRHLSLVDCLSFLVMRLYEVNEAMFFDGDFDMEGFTRYRG